MAECREKAVNCIKTGCELYKIAVLCVEFLLLALPQNKNAPVSGGIVSVKIL